MFAISGKPAAVRARLPVMEAIFSQMARKFNRQGRWIGKMEQ
jgi:hypothetical protein